MAGDKIPKTQAATQFRKDSQFSKKGFKGLKCKGLFGCRLLYHWASSLASQYRHHPVILLFILRLIFYRTFATDYC